MLKLSLSKPIVPLVSNIVIDENTHDGMKSVLKQKIRKLKGKKTTPVTHP